MICGVDEAGRGPVMGPLVVCGVSVEDEAPLVGLGVRDSKKLTRSRRDELAPRIIEVSQVEVVEVSAEEIDALRERMTINQLEAMLFARVIDRLSPTIAYLDAADVSEERFCEMTRSHMSCGASTVAKHRADDAYPVVSAASIIAKVTRDRRVGLIERELGTSLGSGYASDPVTRAFLQNWIAEKGSLPPHTRRSWETSQKLMNLKGMRTLESFEG
ncbi:MAG: ribonuclease HII [Methanobacteriota archaeon]|nr:MAG: ribonuclease HII [Euryarchaeota archaeon]